MFVFRNSELIKYVYVLLPVFSFFYKLIYLSAVFIYALQQKEEKKKQLSIFSNMM